MVKDNKSLITLIELEDHYELLVNFIELFNNTKYHIKILVRQSQSTLFNDIAISSNIDLYYKSEDISIREFLIQKLDIINDSDAIIFNTIQYSPKQYPIDHMTPLKIIRIHNLHTSLDPLHHISVSFDTITFFKDLKFTITDILMGYMRRLKRIISKADFIMLPTLEMSEHARRISPELGSKIFSTLPYTHSPQNAVTTIREKEEITFTVLGSISTRKKDFDVVIAVLTSLQGRLSKRVNINILGAASDNYGRKIIKKISQLETTYIRINATGQFTSQAELSNVMKSTDFLFNPCFTTTRFKIFSEVYGVSKYSGVFSDVVKFQKPCILPSQLKIPSFLNSVCVKYISSENLTEILFSLIESYPAIKDYNFSEIKESYSISNLRNKLVSDIQQMKLIKKSENSNN